jgi:hypothetical protein
LLVTKKRYFLSTIQLSRYMFLIGQTVFRFVVKGVNVIFLGFQRGWGLLYNPKEKLKFPTLMLITSKWIIIET